MGWSSSIYLGGLGRALYASLATGVETEFALPMAGSS